MHFTEDEIREIRNRLPLEVPTVTDSLQSSDGSSALSAKQGNLLGGRLSLVESTEAAMRNIQTIYPWNGPSGVYSMVSVPDDTVNNATNVRVAYELKKRTDDLSTQVNYIQQIIDQLTSGSGGGGGGSTVSWGIEDSSAHTVPLVVNGVSKTVCLNGYSSGGGGGTGGGYIGTTEVKSSSTPGQNLEGIGNATLSGNLTVGGTVFLPATGKIVFGSNASTDPFIEYVAGTTNQFHFNKGLYSDYNVTAGGVGTGGGGGGGVSNLKELSDVYHNGTGVLRSDGTTNVQNGDNLIYDSTNNRWYAYPSSSTLAGLTDVNENLNPSVGQVLYYTGSTNKWDAKNLALSDISGMPTPGTTTGYLKYTYSGGVGTWSIAAGSSGGVNSVTWDTTGITTTGWTTIGYLRVDDGQQHSYSVKAPSGSSGTDTWRPISVNGIQKLGSSTSSGDLNFEGQGNTSVSYSNGSIVISSSGGSSGGITGITMNGSSVSVSGGIANLGTVITSETQLSKGTTSGSGNAVTDISVSGHQITLTKGSTFALASALDDYVTLATDQHNISGAKSFTNSAGIGIGSSSHTLKYNSSQNRFEFNGNLYVTGNIIATGAVTAGA